jgi:flagellin
MHGEGSSYRVTLGAQSATYAAYPSDTVADIARGLKTAIDALGIDNLSTRTVIDQNGRSAIKLDLSEGADIPITLEGSTAGQPGGKFVGLAAFDVTTEDGARQALGMIEPMIQAAIDAAAEFGSSQGRIDTQSQFVSEIIDGLTSGIGALVDADMEEASAKLSALQVQQQLGIQALTIANQQPQNILALFQN